MTDPDTLSIPPAREAALNPVASALLAKTEKSRRGRLKLFFGAAPGVGKTCAMLEEARNRRSQGLEALIGWVDTHGRRDTAALLSGLEVLPRRQIFSQGFRYEEFDIDEVLRRHPALVIVDELAHSNAPGSRHAKRWQDVEELTAAGIDVWSAVNVQHLESLNGVVEKLTGIAVSETVPDRLFDDAAEVRLVDLPPDDLAARLKAGKIYPLETADAALRGFFRKSNLHALRELALRKMAIRVTSTDRVPAHHDPASSSPSALLLWITDRDSAAALVRECARLAYSMQLPWHAVWADTGKARDDVRIRIGEALRLAEELGASVQIIESASAESALSAFALRRGFSVLVTSSASISSRLRRELAAKIPSLSLMALAVPQQARENAMREALSAFLKEVCSDGWWQSVAAVILLSLTLALLDGIIKPDTLALFYLFPTLFSALRFGAGAAVLTVVLSAIVFDLFFIDPRYTLAVADFSYMLLLAAMLCVGIGTGTLIAKLKRLSGISAVRSSQMQALLSLSKALGRAMTAEEIASVISQHIRDSRFEAETELWECLDDINVLNPVGRHSAGTDPAVAKWCAEHADEAGCGTHTLASSPYLYLPLKGSIRVRGILVFISKDKSVLCGIDFRRFAHAAADLAALALERLHYVDVSQKAMVEMEAQRFRHMLISELSHDLRTPLTALLGNAEALHRRLSGKDLPEAQSSGELLESIGRMTSLTDNLLEMARLQSGTVQLKREWIPAGELLSTAVAAMPASLRKKFEISIHAAPDCPFAYADARLINRLLVNLLDNAMKYCPEGSRIALDARRSGAHLVLSVSDSGPGLPEDASSLFDPFKRGTEEPGIVGIGLGLSIGKMIARAHEGQLIASNNPDGGAKFSLVLPLKAEPQLEDPDDADELSSEPASGQLRYPNQAEACAAAEISHSTR